MSRNHVSRPILALALAGALFACRSQPAPDTNHELHDMWAGTEVRRASIRQAILAQGTLFPYHFEVGSPALNPLGERDLDLLAEHLQANPGELRVRRGSVSEELYARRVSTVLTELGARGVDPASITVTDDLPAGPGTWSETVLTRTQSKEPSSDRDQEAGESIFGTSSITEQGDDR